jgi:hypothetical protein
MIDHEDLVELVDQLKERITVLERRLTLLETKSPFVSRGTHTQAQRRRQKRLAQTKHQVWVDQ